MQSSPPFPLSLSASGTMAAAAAALQTDDADKPNTNLDAMYAEKAVAVTPNSSDDSSVENAVQWDETATKKLIRKIDWRLIPFLALLYLLSFLDRTNIGNARLDTLEADLGMSGLQYNHALAIFFPFYVAAEVPSNMMMKRFRPSVWIPAIMVAWYVLGSPRVGSALHLTPSQGTLHHFDGYCVQLYGPAGCAGGAGRR